MSRRLILSLLLIGATPLGAQAPGLVPESVLRNRLVNLKARRAVLESLVARRDSLRLEQELVAVGHPPLILLVPVWAAEESAPIVDSVVTAWEARIGPLFQRAPAETLKVPFRTDTVGFTAEQVEQAVSSQPSVIHFHASRGSADRVYRELGPGMMHWLGEGVPHPTPGIARREAILALSRDTSGRGVSCLEGSAAACLEMLRRESMTGAQVRSAFAQWAIDEVGVAGWERLAADPAGAPEARVVALVGGDPASAAGRWITALRDPASSPTRQAGGYHLLALAWAAGLVLLFLWRLTWHRA